MPPVLLILVAGIPIDRTIEALPKTTDVRVALAAAGKALAGRRMTIGGFVLDGGLFEAIAKAPASEPIERAVREGLHRPVDVQDLILFLDDVIASNVDGPVTITADRARSFGIFIHPKDVFGTEPKVYGDGGGSIPIDDPPLQKDLEPAEDGDPPGPRWTARYQQPESFADRLAELEQTRPVFGARMKSLVAQLEARGASIIVESAVRSRARGYLIYGSYFASRAKSPRELDRRIRTLDRYNRDWGLDVPITWRHPGGFSATVEAARLMADTYGVDFATPTGARRSDHYDGKAVDLVAVDLPRTLELTAPDGTKKTFDLTAPNEPRDLNLTPALIDWIEKSFGVRKVREDYPHWADRDPNR
jgi:hypothetical protein